MKDAEQQTTNHLRIEGGDRSEISAVDDRFFFSPDVGKLVQRGDLFYTEYGCVYQRDALIRMVSVNSVDENYADWTEEHRREVRGAIERQLRLEEIEKTVRQAHRDALVEQARTKLTEEEFDAIYDQGVAHGNE